MGRNTCDPVTDADRRTKQSAKAHGKSPKHKASRETRALRQQPPQTFPSVRWARVSDRRGCGNVCQADHRVTPRPIEAAQGNIADGQRKGHAEIAHGPDRLPRVELKGPYFHRVCLTGLNIKSNLMFRVASTINGAILERCNFSSLNPDHHV